MGSVIHGHHVHFVISHFTPNWSRMKADMIKDKIRLDITLYHICVAHGDLETERCKHCQLTYVYIMLNNSYSNRVHNFNFSQCVCK